MQLIVKMFYIVLNFHLISKWPFLVSPKQRNNLLNVKSIVADHVTMYKERRSMGSALVIIFMNIPQILAQ